MYKRILVPLDGSEYSECILPHARAIATGCQGQEVVLLSVVEPPQPEGTYRQGLYIDTSVLEQVHQATVTERKDYLDNARANLGLAAGTVQTIVMEGPPAEQILDYARKNEVDLIMMGTHGRSGIARWAMGSVTDRVLRHSAAPVMVAAPSGCRV